VVVAAEGRVESMSFFRHGLTRFAVLGVAGAGVVSASLYAAQGGFSGAHSRLELGIFMLGLPWELFLVLLPYKEWPSVLRFSWLVVVPCVLNLGVVLGISAVAERTKPTWRGVRTGALIGAAVGVFSITLAFAMAGAGHGSYGAAKVLFPYSMFVAMRVTHYITIPLQLVAAAQYPLYGIALGLAGGRRKQWLRTLLVVHSAAFVLCLIVSDGEFPTWH